MLTITEILRKKGVVGKFVEFYGPGLAHLTIADRVTLGNMCPEYGATVAIFPIDEMTLDYLRLTGRDETQIALVEAYARAQGMFRTDDDAGRGLHRDDGAGSRRRSSRAWPVRAVRRTACRCPSAKRAFAGALDELKKGVKVGRPRPAAPRSRSRRSSSTAPSSSPRSRAAPTPPIPA